ncbi:U4/U6.U5 tri-snRNP-associated protein 1 [Toxorhynchites rutilus septentrionalis]|uniref:U4/U6.U5 tri-snRNP-associated protein 1 n=1 Tax=Toxorhynchites rutilus septentrionalis TaxID=329112 RepID=UPI0024788BCC|nr:U4/U6.U5 tri-snRNP-associated protein 1 [Toxorhynchites rutilus septentrionalis]
MGSSKKHKKESKKSKRRSRSRSPYEKRSRSDSVEDDQEVIEYERYRKDSSVRYETVEKPHRHRKHKRDKEKVVESRHHQHQHGRRRNRLADESNGQDGGSSSSSHRHRAHKEREYVEVEDDSDSSDCVEVPVDDDIPPPPPPCISRRAPSPEPEPPHETVTRSSRSRRSPSPVVVIRKSPSPPRVVVSRRRSPSPPPRVVASRKRSPSPPRVAAPRRRSPSPPRVAAPRRRSPSPPPRVAVSRRRTPSPSPVKAARRRSPSPVPVKSSRQRSMSPIPDNGAGDVLSIEATNKLRAKLGLKPLEVGPSESSASSGAKKDEDTSKDASGYEKIKDDWGEFYHKPATNLAEKSQADKIREKLKERKEKRAVEDRLKKLQTLGDDEEMDDVKNWVSKSRDKERLKREAEARAKLLDQLDEEFGVGDLVEQDVRAQRKNAYKERDLSGLRVEHDVESFKEGRQVILTLKDADVLDEEAGDTLVNVNMIDDERYKKNTENRKLNPNHYGYDVYSQDDVDEFGMPKQREVLGKYNDEIGSAEKSSFTIGSNAEHEAREKRRQLEIKAKLQNKKLDSLDVVPLALASEYYTDVELASFRKPKKKVRKIRQKLKADDLLDLAPETTGHDLGSKTSRRAGHSEHNLTTESHIRNRKKDILFTDDTSVFQDDLSNIEVADDDDDDLQAVLAKARRLKQKDAIISKALPIDTERVKSEIKSEMMSEDEEANYDARNRDGAILLNATAEFCRTLGDIPTYGLAGNRDEDVAEMMDFENESEQEQDPDQRDRGGTWNSVNTDREQEEQLKAAIEVDDVAILDEEPDVASGVAGALLLAKSKGYLEKEESNRPSNARFAHLQAQNYSIEDKNYGEDDKYSRRDRYSGPITDFRDKDNFKPNVKLEYIDDNGHLLTPKEAFRYLSHKFHGKGPGKNKVEKRLKKNEQEGLMKKMSSTDTPLGTLNMLQAKQKETQSPFIVLSGSKQNTSIVKHKR